MGLDKTFEDEFSAVMETLEGAYEDRMRGEDANYKEGYRGALAFAIELVNRRLGAFAPSKQNKQLVRLFEGIGWER